MSQSPRRTFTLHINGVEQKPVAAGDDLLVNVLHEELGLTGTKLSCGIGACGACKVIAQKEPGGPKMAMLACYARMDSIEALHITTVEGLKGPEGELHPLQQEFLDGYAFQCGYSTPGFLMAAAVLMDQLERRPVPVSKLDNRIRQAISGNLCRCTGYVKYAQAIKNVILATPGLTCEEEPAPDAARSVVTFRIRKQSSNDLEEKALVGFFDQVDAEVHFATPFRLDTCTAKVSVKTGDVRTGEPVRDFNLRRFFFQQVDTIDFTLDSAEVIDGRYQLDAVPFGTAIPVNIHGRLGILGIKLPADADAVVTVLDANTLRITSRAPVAVDMRDCGFAVDSFAKDFFLKLGRSVEVTFDLLLENNDRSPMTWSRSGRRTS